jgi:competence protein ComGC
MKAQGSSLNPQKAFTLTELAVVIATIIVLAGLILPALAAPKIKSAAAACLGNLRQLQTGWEMYKDDNNDVMIPVGPLGVMAYESWCGPATGEGWGPAPGNRNVSYYTSSLIAPYISSNVTVFKCPADVVPSQNGQRLRSYSMNGQMGAVYGARNYDAGYRQYTNGSDLTCPAPAHAFIFLDEHPGSINDGDFEISSSSPEFLDVPASYLEGACGFSFADGHAEIHQWQTASIGLPVTYGVTVSKVTVAANNADWLWLTQRAACHQ